eukprot:TRINITY_DN84232_c0_g1_i1.p1 TRINITY_DN84232_c0_g1~~TRINITY_DN84232_c0_g1_i1.p1  ORF type:complete len:490 (-),score=82.08 TRINITY_DN84232_c0_g1_i1:84-1553(-)
MAVRQNRKTQGQGQGYTADDARRKPKGDKDAQPINATMTTIDGLRVMAVLEKGIERLQLLSLLNYDAFPNSADQYLEIRGFDDGPTGVGNILDEQKRMEGRYEELLVATSKMKPNVMDPVLDQQCYANVEDAVEKGQKNELQNISEQLKEFSKQLCRQLKENPNDSDNWKKVLNERAELTNMLVLCVKELTSSVSSAASANSAMQLGLSQSQPVHFETGSQKSGESSRSYRSNSQFGGAVRNEVSYEVFAKKVLDEQSEKLWADDIVKREKETNLNVKHLQNEVNAERQLKEKEIDERQTKLNDLKTKVRKLKQDTKEQAEKRRAETEAQAEARAREAKDRQRLLQETIANLDKKLQIENEVFAQIEKHLNKKSSQLQTKTSEWTYRQVEENKELDDVIMQERKKRDDQIEKLKLAEEKYAAEVERKKEREETERKNQADKKRWEDLQSSEYKACTKLQAAFKAYLIRRALQEAKKKKRGKRGGKKKKK